MLCSKCSITFHGCLGDYKDGPILDVFLSVCSKRFLQAVLVNLTETANVKFPKKLNLTDGTRFSEKSFAVFLVICHLFYGVSWSQSECRLGFLTWGNGSLAGGLSDGRHHKN